MIDGLELKTTVRRKHHRTFMEKAAEQIGNGEHAPLALTEAVQETYRAKRYHNGPRAQINAYRKAAKLLQRSDVQHGFRLLFEAEGFTDTDAIRKHIEHIRTPVPGSPLGNYQALRDYFSFTAPKPTINVKVKSENLTAVVVSSRDNQPPPIRARKIELNP